MLRHYNNVNNRIKNRGLHGLRGHSVHLFTRYQWTLVSLTLSNIRFPIFVSFCIKLGSTLCPLIDLSFLQDRLLTVPVTVGKVEQLGYFTFSLHHGQVFIFTHCVLANFYFRLRKGVKGSFIWGTYSTMLVDQIYFSSTIFYTHNSLGIIILSYITYDQPIGFSSLSSFIYPAT